MIAWSKSKPLFRNSGIVVNTSPSLEPGFPSLGASSNDSGCRIHSWTAEPIFKEDVLNLGWFLNKAGLPPSSGSIHFSPEFSVN